MIQNCQHYDIQNQTENITFGFHRKENEDDFELINIMVSISYVLNYNPGTVYNYVQIAYLIHCLLRIYADI